MKKNNSTVNGALHQLFSANPGALDDCLSFACPGDEILLINNGVLLLEGETMLKEKSDRRGIEVSTSALSTDVMASGLEREAKEQGIKLLSELEWLERVQAYKRILSWK